MAEPANLLSIPDELKLTIAKNLTSSADLINLCLACRKLRDIAEEPLYSTIELSARSVKRIVSRSLNSQNRGLKHVKTLRVLGHDMRCYHTAHWRRVLSLLNSIPERSLRVLDIDTFACMPSELLMPVYARQSALRHLVMHHERPACRVPCRIDLQNLSAIRSVDIYIRDEADCRRGRDILMTATRLEALSISRPGSHIHIDPSLSTARIFDLLFERPQGTNLIARLTPRSLRLQRFTLFQGSEKVRECIDTSNLKRLFFRRCAYTQGVLGDLLQHQAIDLNVLKHIVDDLPRNCKKPQDHVKPLKAFTALETLQISGALRDDAHYEFSLDDIFRHGPTLRILHIDSAGQNRDPDRRFVVQGQGYPLSQFAVTCRACPQLAQLVVPPPFYSLWEQKTPNSGLYSRDHNRFVKFLGAVRNLRSLVSLKLILYQRMGQVAPPNRPGVERALTEGTQSMANTVFAEVHERCPEFRALVLEVRPAVADGFSTILPRQFGFLRGMRADPSNRETETAIGIPIEVGPLKRRVASNEIFEEDIGRLWLAAV